MREKINGDEIHSLDNLLIPAANAIKLATVKKFVADYRAKSREESAVRDALAQTKNFPGVTGKITLDANRNADVPVYMLRIEKGGKFTLQQ